jgi:hypothetical protein
MLQSKYLEQCKSPSDIHEHLPTLARYARECTHVTECGVRTCISTYAFAEGLRGRPGTRIIQVDPQWHPNIVTFQSECKAEGLDAVFYRNSDLECPMEPTDLLFLDTWHIYGHLKRELARWHSHVRSYILLHDTTVDEWIGETVRMGWDAVQQSRETGIPVEEIRKGLWPAVEEFLAAHPEWRLRERLTNCNGLTVLERVRPTEPSAQ